MNDFVAQPSHSHDSASSTSSSLLDRAREQDAEAWENLVALYGPLVGHWLSRWHVPNHEREDMAQEVFIAVFRSIRKYRPTRDAGSFRAWLWTITRNKLRDRYRRTGREVSVAVGGDAQSLLEQIPEDFSDSTADGIIDDVNQQMLHRALDLLRPRFEQRTWEAFWRATVDQHASEDIASDLKMTISAVYQAKSRVLRRLRHELEGLVDL